MSQSKIVMRRTSAGDPYAPVERERTGHIDESTARRRENLAAKELARHRDQMAASRLEGARNPYREARLESEGRSGSWLDEQIKSMPAEAERDEHGRCVDDVKYFEKHPHALSRVRDGFADELSDKTLVRRVVGVGDDGGDQIAMLPVPDDLAGISDPEQLLRMFTSDDHEFPGGVQLARLWDDDEDTPINLAEYFQILDERFDSELAADPGEAAKRAMEKRKAFRRGIHREQSRENTRNDQAHQRLARERTRARQRRNNRGRPSQVYQP